MIDWVDGVISDETGNLLAAQAGVPQAYEAVLAMRRAAACCLKIPEPTGHINHHQSGQEEQADASFPPLSHAHSQRIEHAAELAWKSQGLKQASSNTHQSIKFPPSKPLTGESSDTLDSSSQRTSHVAFWRRASTLRFAAAASVTLAIGSMAWLAISSRKEAGNENGLAQGQTAVAMKSKAGQSGSVSESSASLAFAESSTDAPSAMSFASESTDEASLTSSQSAELALANATNARDASGEAMSRVVVDPSRAVELARQGRLLIRVGAVSGSAIPQLDSLVSGSSWHVREDVSQSLVEAVRPYLTAPEKTLAARVNDEVVRSTGFGPPDPPEGSNVFAAMRHVMFGPDAPWNETSATYMIEVANSQDALEVVRSVTQQRFAANVRFEELPTPVGQIDWNGRLSVPVIVESH